MNPKLIVAAVGLASGLAGKLYVNRIMDKATESLIQSRLAQTANVEPPSAPETTPQKPKTLKFKQCKPSHK